MSDIRFSGVVATVLAGLLASTADAGQTTNATILELSINRPYGDVVFVRLNALPASPASCSTGGYWQYTLSLGGLAGKELYTMLIAAQLSGHLVTVTGTGSCSEFGSVESIAGVNTVG